MTFQCEHGCTDMVREANCPEHGIVAFLKDEPAPDQDKYAYNSDAWWPEGLPQWIAWQARDDELFAAFKKGLNAFGWPAYNVPLPLPREDSWPGIALALAQRIRELQDELERQTG